MTALPAWISAALQTKLENVSRNDLRARAQAISERYRAGGSSDIIRNAQDALAYAVVRMPATYAAVHAVLGQITPVLPDFAPRTVLDIGAGPGTASWAVQDLWPSVESVTLIDQNPHLLALADALKHAPEAPAGASTALRGDLTAGLAAAPASDVVIASYALTELAAGSRAAVLKSLWRLAGKLLIVVEPGTVAGFENILRDREALLAQGGTIVAPCSHEGRCPLAGAARWCHFSARLPRLRDHMATKGARVPYEDEKFSYLAVGKETGAIKRGRRILATPVVTKAQVVLTSCAPDQPQTLVIERAQKDAYRTAKRTDWGDTIAV